MDIIVTTPKSQIANAAREAAECIADGGGEYFRRFHSLGYPRDLCVGDRVYYVEDGFIRGFCLVKRLLHSPTGQTCDTTGRIWAQGFFVFMDASSWQWIKPLPLVGFQGFRYVRNDLPWPAGLSNALIVGGWRDPRPEVRA
jgi:hypothetical protein